MTRFKDFIIFGIHSIIKKEGINVMEIIGEKLADVIKKRRTLLQYTQEELGKKTGINRQMIGRIENNKYIPSMQQLSNLSDALDFNIGEVIGEKKERNIFVAMMGEAQTENEKEWLEKMTSMMLCLRKHYRLRNAMYK